nr:ATP synthase F0 subunit 6 [Amblyseius swirskii]
MFDPTTNLGSLNWLILMIPLLTFNKMFFLLNSRNNFIYMNMNKFMEKNIKTNLKNSFQKSQILLMTMFTIIFMMNLISITPYVFTTSSHLSFTLTLSLPLWLTLMIKSWLKNFQHTLMHLVPMSTPMLLCPLMVMIETISNLIRPATLAIRLTANMIAGHILMALLGNLLSKSLLFFLMSNMIMNTLIILEISVCMIQAYVFTMLISLYLNEVKDYPHKLLTKVFL